MSLLVATERSLAKAKREENQYASTRTPTVRNLFQKR